MKSDVLPGGGAMAGIKGSMFGRGGLLVNPCTRLK